MQNENQNNTPETSPPPAPPHKNVIAPINEAAVREHLAANPAPEPLRPPVAPPDQTDIAAQSAVPGTPPAQPNVDNFEWKPKTRLAHRSKLLRIYTLILIIAPLLVLATVLLSGVLTMAAYNSAARLISIISLGMIGLTMLMGIILYTTKSKRLANTLITVLLALSVLSLVGAVISLNIIGIIMGVIALIFIGGVKREVDVLA